MIDDLDILTLDELHNTKALLIDEVQAIELQLSDRDKRDAETGERLDYRSYHTWRRNAITARSYKLKEIRAINARIHKLSDNEAQLQLNRIENKLDKVIEYLEEEVEEE